MLAVDLALLRCWVFGLVENNVVWCRILDSLVEA